VLVFRVFSPPNPPRCFSGHEPSGDANSVALVKSFVCPSDKDWPWRATTSPLSNATYLPHFDILTHSFASLKSASPLFSTPSELFAQNTQGVAYPSQSLRRLRLCLSRAYRAMCAAYLFRFFCCPSAISCNFLRSLKIYLQSFQHLPRSLHKTPRVWVPNHRNRRQLFPRLTTNYSLPASFAMLARPNNHDTQLSPLSPLFS
jgi:hypothetical protein